MKGFVGDGMREVNGFGVQIQAVCHLSVKAVAEDGSVETFG